MTRQNINLVGLLLFIIVVIVVSQNLDIARAQTRAAGVALRAFDMACASRVGGMDGVA